MKQHNEKLTWRKSDSVLRSGEASCSMIFNHESMSIVARLIISLRMLPSNMLASALVLSIFISFNNTDIIKDADITVARPAMKTGEAFKNNLMKFLLNIMTSNF